MYSELLSLESLVRTLNMALFVAGLSGVARIRGGASRYNCITPQNRCRHRHGVSDVRDSVVGVHDAKRATAAVGGAGSHSHAQHGRCRGAHTSAFHRVLHAMQLDAAECVDGAGDPDNL